MEAHVTALKCEFSLHLMITLGPILRAHFKDEKVSLRSYVTSALWMTMYSL